MVDLYRKNIKTIFTCVPQSSRKFHGFYLVLVSPIAFIKLFLMKHLKGGLGPYFDLNYSLRNKVVFVHVPKAAGRSVRDAIMDGRSASHLTANVIRLGLGNRLFEECFSFAFVRHPFDRFESAYYFLKAGGVSKRDRYYKRKYFSDDCDINKFIEGMLGEKLIYHIVHFRPQVEFLEIDGKIGVNFIGKYENLENDFVTLKDVMAKDFLTLPWNNKTDYGKINLQKSPRVALSAKSKEKLYKFYQRDFLSLGYIP